MAETDNSLMLSILRELRSDMGEHRRMLMLLVEASRRHDRRFEDIERRISDSRDEMELMLKGELMGGLTHFETQIDERLLNSTTV